MAAAVVVSVWRVRRVGGACEAGGWRVRGVWVACAVYALGDIANSTCLAGYFKINDESTCAAAAASVQRTYAGSKTAADWPSGCYWQTNEINVYLNLHPIGAATANAQPLCASGAPMPPTWPTHRCRHAAMCRMRWLGASGVACSMQLPHQRCDRRRHPARQQR